MKNLLRVCLIVILMVAPGMIVFIPSTSATDLTYLKTITYTHTQNVWRNGTTNQYFFSDTEYGLRYCTSDDGETFTLVDTVDDDANRGYFYVIGDGTYVYASLEWWDSPTYPNYIVAYSVSPTGLTEVGRVAVSNQESERFWATSDHVVHINQLAKNMSAYYFDGADFSFVTDVADGGWYRSITGDPDNENYIFCVRYLLSPRWYNVTVYYWDGASYTRINDYSDGSDINDPTPLKDSDWVLISEFEDGKTLLGFDGLDFYYYDTIDDSSNDAFTSAGLEIYGDWYYFWSERDGGISYYYWDGVELVKVDTLDNGNNLFNILCDNYLVYACYVGTGVVIYDFPSYDDVYVSGTMNVGWYDASHVHTIQEGLSNVSYGGNVHIWNGTYRENNLDILQPVNLMGNSSSVVTIDGESNDILWIDSYDVLVSGIKFYNASNCITTFGFDNITITDNYFNYSMSGYVTFYKETNLTIKDSIFNDLLYGVYIDLEFAESGCDILIYNNNFYYNFLNAFTNMGEVSSVTWNITKTLGTNIIGGPYLGGNYWDNYTGSDTTVPPDGIGDTDLPYNSSGNIYYGGDYLPLVTYELITDVWVDDDQAPGWYDASHVHTIQEGINNVTENYTVYVWDGAYSGLTWINKSCSIWGNGTSPSTLFEGEMIINASNITIRDIHFNNTPTGFFIDNFDGLNWLPVSNIGIFDCLFTNSTFYAIDIEDNFSSVSIFQNEFYDIDYFAIYLYGDIGSYSCDSCTVFSNNITGTRNAITFAGRNSAVYLNTILNGLSIPVFYYPRLAIWDSELVDVYANTIDIGDWAGIQVGTSNNCSFHDNFITGFNSTQLGIECFSDTYDNWFYDNYVSNDNNVHDEGFNFWNTTKTLETNIIGGPYTGGNYWSDYTGYDTNADGIGETQIPYTNSLEIYNGGDYLPLTNLTGSPPDAPTNFTATNIHANHTQHLTWTNAPGFDKTVIRYSTSGFPANPQSGISLYNGTGTSCYCSSPLPGQLYYYCAWTFYNNTFSNVTHVGCLTKPLAPTNIVTQSMGGNTINITWTKGVGSNRTIVVEGNGHYPTTINDGVILYNGTNEYYATNFTLNVRYIGLFGFTTWTYNPTLIEFSDPPSDIVYKYLYVNCFNESNPYQSIPFNMQVRNQDGSEVYQQLNISTWTCINLSSFVAEEKIYVRVWSDRYQARERFIPVFLNQYYNFSFYLPLKVVKTGDDREGGGNIENCDLRAFVDSTSCSGDSSDVTISLSNYLDTMITVSKYDSYYGWTAIPSNKYTYNTTAVVVNKTGLNANTSMVQVNYYYYFCQGDTVIAVYYCRVVESVDTGFTTYDRGVENAVVSFKRFMNTTGEYEIVGDTTADANGYVAIYLIPNVQYLVTITADGFITQNSSYTPYPANAVGQTVEKVFRLVRITNQTYNYTYLFQNIQWSFEPKGYTFHTGFTAYFNITSSDDQLEWFSMRAYSYNYSTYKWDLLSYQISYTPGGGSISYTIANISGKYDFECWFKKVGYPAYECSGAGSFEDIIAHFSQWMLDIPDQAYYIILVVIMCIVAGFSFLYLGAGILTGYIALAVMMLGLLIKPIEVVIGNGLSVSGWLIFIITFFVYSLGLFLWSRI